VARRHPGVRLPVDDEQTRPPRGQGRYGVHRTEARGVDPGQRPGHHQRPRREPPRQPAQAGHLRGKHLLQVGVRAVRGDDPDARVPRGEEQTRRRPHGVAHDVDAVRRQPVPVEEVDRAGGVAHLVRAHGVPRPPGASVAAQIERHHRVPVSGQGGGDLQEPAVQFVLPVAAAAVHQHHGTPGAALVSRVGARPERGDEPPGQGDRVSPTREDHRFVAQSVVRREPVRRPPHRAGERVRHHRADDGVGQDEAEREGAGHDRRSKPARGRPVRSHRAGSVPRGSGGHCPPRRCGSTQNPDHGLPPPHLGAPPPPIRAAPGRVRPRSILRPCAGSGIGESPSPRSRMSQTVALTTIRVPLDGAPWPSRRASVRRVPGPGAHRRPGGNRPGGERPPPMLVPED